MPGMVNTWLRSWWLSMAEVDIQAVVSKQAEYGSLRFHAAAITEMSPVLQHDGLATEAVLVQYIAGKLGRVLHALSLGERCSDDTLDDLACYVMMLRYVRQHGRWP